MKKNLRPILLLLTFLILYTCDKPPNAPTDPDNPLDPDNPSYSGPVIDIIGGPAEGSVYASDTLTIRMWSNHDNMSYRFKWDDEEEWSEYVNTSEVFFEFLNEGLRTIEVQGRYESNGDTSAVVARSFTLNSIQGPALYIYPKRKVISTGAQFQLEFWLESTEDIAGISTQLIFEPARLRIDDVDFLEDGEQSIMLQNGGQLIVFSDINSAAGTLDIDCAVVEGDPHDIAGIGLVARFQLTHLSGNETSLTLQSLSSLENSDGQPVAINRLLGTQIVVQ